MKTSSLLLAELRSRSRSSSVARQAPPPAAPDTRAADEQAIRDGEAAWVKDFAAKDVDKVLRPLCG